MQTSRGSRQRPGPLGDLSAANLQDTRRPTVLGKKEVTKQALDMPPRDGGCSSQLVNGKREETMESNQPQTHRWALTQNPKGREPPCPQTP